MTASWNGTNGEIDLSYAAACDATDHTIYYGPLSGVSSHSYTGAACGIGTSGSAAFNPFTVLIAQDIAGLQPYSGWGFRMALFVVFALVGIQHLFSYAKKIHGNPEASLIAGIEGGPAVQLEDPPAFNRVHWTVLVLLVLTIVVVVAGIWKYHWYLDEMGAIFLGLSVLIAIVARLSPDGAAKSFCIGAGELTTTALLIGFARTIELVLSDGIVVDTIIHSIAQPLQNLGATGAAVGMFALQSVCNLFSISRHANRDVICNYWSVASRPWIIRCTRR